MHQPRARTSVTNLGDVTSLQSQTHFLLAAGKVQRVRVIQSRPACCWPRSPRSPCPGLYGQPGPLTLAGLPGTRLLKSLPGTLASKQLCPLPAFSRHTCTAHCQKPLEECHVTGLPFPWEHGPPSPAFLGSRASQASPERRNRQEHTYNSGYEICPYTCIVHMQICPLKCCLIPLERLVSPGSAGQAEDPGKPMGQGNSTRLLENTISLGELSLSFYPGLQLIG